MNGMQQVHKLKPDESRESDGEPVYLTPQGIERLCERLIRLKDTLPEQAAEAERAAAFGDRSENAAYKDAKALLRRTHRQIFTIENQLKRAVPIASGPSASGKVQMGSTVILELLAGGARKTFRILGPRETDPSGGRISHESPLGAALMHRAQGETVNVETPNGTRGYRIIEIR